VTPHPHDYDARHRHGIPTSDLYWLRLAEPARRIRHPAPGGWVSHPADQPCPDCLITTDGQVA
jgi:hypothetical protein